MAVLLPPPPRRQSSLSATTRPAPTHERYLDLRVRPRAQPVGDGEAYQTVVVPTRPAVDVVYSVWHDAGYGCEERILPEIPERYNFTVYRPAAVRPRSGIRISTSGSNQWDAIRRALGAALATHGDVERSTGSCSKARTDLAFSTIWI